MNARPKLPAEESLIPIHLSLAGIQPNRPWTLQASSLSAAETRTALVVRQRRPVKRNHSKERASTIHHHTRGNASPRLQTRRPLAVGKGPLAVLEDLGKKTHGNVRLCPRRENVAHARAAGPWWGVSGATSAKKSISSRNKRC